DRGDDAGAGRRRARRPAYAAARRPRRRHRPLADDLLGSHRKPHRRSMDTARAVSTDRYNKKKEAIIAAAAGILNRRGVRGMTLADVAASVDLITTSVTYYF